MLLLERLVETDPSTAQAPCQPPRACSAQVQSQRTPRKGRAEHHSCQVLATTHLCNVEGNGTRGLLRTLLQMKHVVEPATVMQCGLPLYMPARWIWWTQSA